jgi:cytochrome c biogenesis protein
MWRAQVFMDGGRLYAFKGLAGRLAPIGVHASLVLIMLGCTAGALGGFKGEVMVPEGQAFRVADFIQAVCCLRPM